MTRLVLLLLIAVVLWVLLEWGYRKLMTGLGLDPRTGRGRERRTGPGASRSGEALVRCDACGTYVPASRALSSRGGRRVCSETCRARLRSP